MKKKPFQRHVISHPPKQQLNIKRNGWYYIYSDPFVHKYVSFFGTVVWYSKKAIWIARLTFMHKQPKWSSEVFTDIRKALKWVETAHKLRERNRKWNMTEV